MTLLEKGTGSNFVDGCRYCHDEFARAKVSGSRNKDVLTQVKCVSEILGYKDAVSTAKGNLHGP
jgi:hypothetical protein